MKLKYKTGRPDAPQLTCYWRIEIMDPHLGDVQLSATEVSGLSERLKYESYRAGGDRDQFPHQRLGAPQGCTVTIKWGFFTEDQGGSHFFFRWKKNLRNTRKTATFNMNIILMDEKENDLLVWQCHHCTPQEYTAPTLYGDKSQVAIQTMTVEVKELVSEIV